LKESKRKFAKGKNYASLRASPATIDQASFQSPIEAGFFRCFVNDALNQSRLTPTAFFRSKPVFGCLSNAARERPSRRTRDP
jgi:hypothetical protein